MVIGCCGKSVEHLAAFALFTAMPLAAQTDTDHASHHADPKVTAAAAASMSDREVRMIDKSAGKVTIKHGPLQSLDMPPMTMVFRVKDPAMLDQVKEGDKIKFSADRVNGALTVTHVQMVRESGSSPSRAEHQQSTCTHRVRLT